MKNKVIEMLEQEIKWANDALKSGEFLDPNNNMKRTKVIEESKQWVPVSIRLTEYYIKRVKELDGE